MKLKKGNADVASQFFSRHHITLIGPPLIAISMFCFGFVLTHQKAVAQLGTTTHSKPAQTAIQPPSGLSFSSKPQLPILPPVAAASSGTPPTDPEDQVAPQLPDVAISRLQKADQRQEPADGNGGDGGSIMSQLQRSLHE